MRGGRAWITVLVAASLFVVVYRPGPLDDLLDRSGIPKSAPLLADPRLKAEPGDPWPDGVVRYFNAAPEHRWALQKAVDAWNATNIQVQFEPAPRDEADVVIESDDEQPCGHGRATLGYWPDSRVVVFRPHRAQGCSRYDAARVLAHELGHVLGLRHRTATCSVMNPSGSMYGGDQCPQPARWQWRCRLLELVDIEAAVRLYGGVATWPPGPTFCEIS